MIFVQENQKKSELYHSFIGKIYIVVVLDSKVIFYLTSFKYYFESIEDNI
jgi:hypothetical protein